MNFFHIFFFGSSCISWTLCWWTISLVAIYLSVSMMENVIQCILSGHLFLWSRSRSLHLYLSLSVALFSHRSRLVGTFVLSADIRYWYFLQIHNNWINTHERHSSLHEHDQHTHTQTHVRLALSACIIPFYMAIYIVSALHNGFHRNKWKPERLGPALIPTTTNSYTFRALFFFSFRSSLFLLLY